MTPRTIALLAASAAALAAPLGAFAQQYGAYAYEHRPSYGEYGADYGQPRGDYGWRRGFVGYPEFRGIEWHIRSEIYQGLRDDTLDREGAHDLLAELQQVRYDEMREYRVYGRNLPYDDRMRIRQALRQLDWQVDQTRAEP